jgi:hypothetical protein
MDDDETPVLDHDGDDVSTSDDWFYEAPTRVC